MISCWSSFGMLIRITSQHAKWTRINETIGHHSTILFLGCTQLPRISRGLVGLLPSANGSVDFWTSSWRLGNKARKSVWPRYGSKISWTMTVRTSFVVYKNGENKKRLAQRSEVGSTRQILVWRSPITSGQRNTDPHLQTTRCNTYLGSTIASGTFLSSVVAHVFILELELPAMPTTYRRFWQALQPTGQWVLCLYDELNLIV